MYGWCICCRSCEDYWAAQCSQNCPGCSSITTVSPLHHCLSHKCWQHLRNILATHRAPLVWQQTTGALSAGEEVTTGKKDHPGLVCHTDLAQEPLSQLLVVGLQVVDIGCIHWKHNKLHLRICPCLEVTKMGKNEGAQVIHNMYAP